MSPCYVEPVTPLERATLSLEGLAIGDAFGESFFVPTPEAVAAIDARRVPDSTWRWTDDTQMAISIVDVLAAHGTIEQDELARRFAERFDPRRGYGEAAAAILLAISEGQPWQRASRGAFRGRGSFGNGAAMRAAPLGAFFADDLERCRDQAVRSAEVTHAHEEGIAGAVAVAVAAALAWTHRDAPLAPTAFLEAIAALVPAGYTCEGIQSAIALPDDVSVVRAAQALGNGSGVTAPDTVPFALWVASRSLGDFERALWDTVRALGDRDTTCAIVGGIVVLSAGIDSIPSAWRASREPLPAGR
jgi:ADP-ribosylglycohydrolase